EMYLWTIPNMADTFGVPVGLSDHTLGVIVPVASVVLGACMIEKHVTLSRGLKTPDGAFSLEPDELKVLVDSVRVTEKALGEVHYGVTAHERQSTVFRRSLFVTEDILEGDRFTPLNV